MKKEFAPGRLDVLAFARAGARLPGRLPLARLARLAAEAAEAAQAGAAAVEWSAEGACRAAAGHGDVPWLHLQARAQLPLVCQRCLEPVTVPLAVDRQFRFAPDEDTAAAEDDTAEEDVLALAHDFDLLALLEDELLMELPAVPRHAVCPTAWNAPGPAAAQPDADAGSGRPHPFAALAGMKTGGQDKS